jgi:putative DNA topoisomerase
MSGKINRQLFTAHEHALEHDPCPECGAELTLRHGKHGPFLGCSNYPECEYIKTLHQNDGHIVKALGVACPECGQELVLRQGRYGMFIGCSGYPECQHIESPDGATHDESPQETIPCPECKTGSLVERKSRFGKTFYACDNYPKCRFAVNNPPVTGQCEECGFALLVEKKLTGGKQLQCADKKCQHIQGSKKPA